MYCLFPSCHEILLKEVFTFLNELFLVFHASSLKVTVNCIYGLAILLFFIFPFAISQCFPKHCQILKSCSIIKQTDGKGSLGVAEWRGVSRRKEYNKKSGLFYFDGKKPSKLKNLFRTVFCIFVPCEKKLERRKNKLRFWPSVFSSGPGPWNLSPPQGLIKSKLRDSLKMLIALHDLSSWTELLGYVFAIFYIQHWILNGYLPNGKENGEHMDQINREKNGPFFFFFLLACFHLLWWNY